MFGERCTRQLRPLPAHGEWDLHPLSWHFPLSVGLALEAQPESDAIFLARIDGEEGPLYFSSSGAWDVCAPRLWGAVVGQRAQALPDGSRGCEVPCP